jgi:opacity protein-like surface antigen
MIKRALLVLSLLLFPFAAFAQQNEFGVFISTSQLDENEIEDAGDIFEIDFEEDMGFGVSYNRFWFGSFSTELAYQRLGADLTVSFENIDEEVGDLDLDVLSATGQLHFLRGGPISPYIGAGVAYISGEAGSIDEEEIDATDLENELDFLVNAGLNVGLGRGFAIFLDGKYIMYEARGEGDPEDEALELNPLIIAGGVKFRF